VEPFTGARSERLTRTVVAVNQKDPAGRVADVAQPAYPHRTAPPWGTSVPSTSSR
jgi:hypothetical protein